MKLSVAPGVFCLVVLVGCSAGSSSETNGSENENADSGDGDAAGDGDADGETGSGGGDGDDGNTDIVVDPGMTTGDGDNASPDCSPKPIGLLRDFRSVSSLGDKEFGDQALLEMCPVYGDFEAKCIGGNVPPELSFIADFCWQLDVPSLGQPEQGIPAEQLGPDRKPIVSDPEKDYETVRSAETFAAWYKDDPNCNVTYEFELPMRESETTGLLVFDSSAFFPLDELGYQEPGELNHNFHFTFELHMEFTYQEGDVFNFSGDDDLFVFIDDKLVIDLGGAHASMDESVNLDELGLVSGETYPIDFFHAERSKGESNFHIETSLQFSNCEPIIVR